VFFTVALSLIARLPALATGLGLLSTNTFPDTPIPFSLSVTTWPLVGALAGGILFSPASLRMMVRRGAGPRSVGLDASRAVGDAEQARAIGTIFSTSAPRKRLPARAGRCSRARVTFFLKSGRHRSRRSLPSWSM
jgi:hypothetical protein